MTKKNLATQYVKNIETHNSHLDDENCRLSGDLQRTNTKVTSLEKSNKKLNDLVTWILEKNQDPAITKEITKVLNDITKELLKR